MPKNTITLRDGLPDPLPLDTPQPTALVPAAGAIVTAGNAGRIAPFPDSGGGRIGNVALQTAALPLCRAALCRWCSDALPLALSRALSDPLRSAAGAMATRATRR